MARGREPSLWATGCGARAGGESGCCAAVHLPEPERRRRPTKLTLQSCGDDFGMAVTGEVRFGYYALEEAS